MKKEPKYIWNEQNGTMVCIIYYKNTNFCGTATCHADDEDFKSERTGSHIAYIRAYNDYLKYIRDSELLPKLEGLNHLYGTMRHSPQFNENSYEASRLFKEITNLQNDLEAVRELIDINKSDLQLYIEEKDKFYKRQRAKHTENGQNN